MPQEKPAISISSSSSSAIPSASRAAAIFGAPDEKRLRCGAATADVTGDHDPWRRRRFWLLRWNGGLAGSCDLGKPCTIRVNQQGARTPMPMWLRLALVSALTALVLGGLAQLITRGKPVTLDGTSGSITPEKTSAAVTVTIGAGVAVAGLWLFLDGHNGFAPLALALAGAAIAGFMAPSLGHRHDVRWTDEVVEGPSRLLGPTLGLARNAIPWRDIVATGATLTGYWYVETRDRRRVYWSFLYQGNQAFAAAIRAHCPSVTVPSR